MEHRKKARIITSQTGLYILAAIVLIGLIFISVRLSTNLKNSASAGACKSQIGAASRGQPVGFSGCKTVRVVFGRNSVTRYTNSDEEIEYSTALARLKKIRPDLEHLEIKKQEPIPEELIYYLIAEEMKKCHQIYYVESLFTKSKYLFEFFPGSIKAQFICHRCATVMFDENFIYTNVLDNFKNFLMSTPASVESGKTYYRYFSEFYPVVENDQPTGNEDEESFLANIDDVKSGLGSIKLIEESLLPKKYDITINPNFSYSLVYFYFHAEKFLKIKLKNEIRPAFINLVTWDVESLACPDYLTLTPEK